MDNALYVKVNGFIDHIRGSSNDIMSAMDTWIEDGHMTQQEFNINEYEILAMIDSQVFTCVCCGWTFNVDEMGKDTNGGELQCESCADD